MPVRADCEFGATGFIDPGDRVDVLLTIDDRETRQAVTKIVLENVVVLATGSGVGQRREDADPDAARVSGRDESYTLEVSPEDGEKLALASSRGRLHLAMRNVLDHDEVLTRGATVRGTLASYLDVAPEPEKPRVVRKAPPRPRVEVIKGTQVSTTTF